MKTIFKSSFSSFFTMVIIVAVAVVLTGRTNTEAKTDLGHVMVDSRSSNVYVEPANLSVTLPPNAGMYFADTKITGIANYLTERGITFAAEMENDTYEIEVHAAPFLVETYYGDSFLEDYLECVAARDETYVVTDAQMADPVIINDMEFQHIYYIKESLRYTEWDMMSAYITVIDNQCVEIILLKYAKESVTAGEVETQVDQELSDIIQSFAYGDKVPKPVTEEGGFWQDFLKYSFSPWIFLIPLLYIFFHRVTVGKSYGEWHEDALEVRHSKSILGFFAVFIVLHHLTQQIGAVNAGALGFLENFGVCFVGMYFFYSGYGLMQSYYDKPGYLKGFFKKRLPSVLIPFYLCTIVFVLNGLILEGEEFSITTLLQLSGFLLINDHAWYIVEIVLLYILFYLFFRFIKKEKIALLLMGISNVLLIAVSLLAGHGDYWFQGEWWYNSTMLFFLGMLFAKYRSGIISYVRKHYTKLLPVVIVLFFVFYFITADMLEKYGYWTEFSDITWVRSIADKALTLSVQLPMIIFFVAGVLLLGQKVQFENGILRFFGSISLELYLIHNLFLRKFSSVGGAGVYCLLVLVCSIIAATLLHKVDTLLLCLVMKKEMPKKVPIILPALRQMRKSWLVAFWISLNRFLRHPKMILWQKFKQLVCIALAFLSVFPIYLTIINATKDHRVFGVSLLPGKSFLSNLEGMNSVYESAGGSIGQGILNSCIIATFSALAATYFGAMTAYAFERYKIKGNRILWGIIVACMMIPQTACFVGLYKILVKLHLMNNFIPIIMMALATPSAVYFIRMYLKSVNFSEIVEAARIDGAGEFRIFNRIILPMIRPVLALQITFSFVAAWNNGYVQSNLLLDWDKKTIAPYVSILSGDASKGLPPEAYALMLASAIVPLLVYTLCSKSIISSITLGGVKE